MRHPCGSGSGLVPLRALEVLTTGRRVATACPAMRRAPPAGTSPAAESKVTVSRGDGVAGSVLPFCTRKKITPTPLFVLFPASQSARRCSLCVPFASFVVLMITGPSNPPAPCLSTVPGIGGSA